MTKLQLLLRELEALDQKIAVARRSERAVILANVREMITNCGFTPREVFGFGSSSRTKLFSVRYKYFNPQTGEAWSGRGREPRWILSEPRETYLLERDRVGPE
ncbi:MULTISPECIES: H-NS histone family protein [Burkholderia cepacia complex]|uniref:H-NS histone family protein n=1 Tax=Burkholderia cepacia complex TaxID=87882 RepID=UPI000D002402|nr:MULTISPECIES: H-NS histone family protein [Burkholderia cepacia complex]MBR8383928.1 H-NS histone family protein [Burkholderia cenocepacia]MBR8434907.1 H-NS histone family protein [Burkholderia cenocepacia]MCO1366481.1 H-NS histone family protein [Burkholderia multivorans]MCO1376090.1 H-NS histone family protein [Burkholderia multivorans]PRG95825.1 H-NS histone [Burkholderia multivorans]